ncbi:MAG: XTP/dITP diphosphatase [Myxococcota bacterium]|jgi:XTP/dITP diphosphohydrolase
MTWKLTSKTIVFASGNAGKIREMSAILAPLGMKIKVPSDFPGAPDPVEDGTTYAENALIKARALCAFTGLPALADDSGLEVDALNGAPGVYSARYAGTDQDAARNRQKVMAELDGVDAAGRTARFVCVIAFVMPGGGEFTFEGECRGLITGREQGSGGFGYDPIFFYPPAGMTMAQMTPGAKNAVSHRSRALAKLCHALKRGEL